MNIVMINNRYFPAVGGSETLIQCLSEALVEDGHQVTVLTTDFRYSTGNERVEAMPEEAKGVKVKRVGGVRLSRDPFTLSGEMASAAVKLSKNADILHTFTYGYHTSVGPALYKRLRMIEVPIVFSPHYAPSRTVPSWASTLFDVTLGNLSIQGSDHVVLLTEKYMNFFLSHGAKSDRLSVVPPIVPQIPAVESSRVEAFLRKHTIPADKRIILSLGRVVEYKGIQLLLESAKCLKDQGKLDELGIHVVISGEGAYRKDLETKVQNSGLEKYVTFTGLVSDEEKNILFSTASVFSLLSYSGESFGIVLAEAMGCGTPLLGSDRGAIPYVMKDGRNGRIVDPFNSHAVAESLIALLDLAEAEKIRKVNREDARKFNKKEVLGKMLSVYESALAS